MGGMTRLVKLYEHMVILALGHTSEVVHQIVASLLHGVTVRAKLGTP
jgi:hypothetical protein